MFHNVQGEYKAVIVLKLVATESCIQMQNLGKPACIILARSLKCYLFDDKGDVIISPLPYTSLHCKIFPLATNMRS